MNKFSKIGISALLSLITVSTASAMNLQPEEDSLSTNNNIHEMELNEQQNGALIQAVRFGTFNEVHNLLDKVTHQELEEALDLAFELDRQMIFFEIYGYIVLNEFEDIYIDEGEFMENAAEQNKHNVFSLFVGMIEKEHGQYEVGNCLYLAAANGHLNIIQMLESHYNLEELVNDLDDEEIDYLVDALNVATENNHMEVRNYLLEKYQEYYQ